MTEVLDAPVTVLAGVNEGDAEKLAAAFGIETVRDPGTNGYFRFAAALVEIEQSAKVSPVHGRAGVGVVQPLHRASTDHPLGARSAAAGAAAAA